jgi:hypothetical protein
MANWKKITLALGALAVVGAGVSAAAISAKSNDEAQATDTVSYFRLWVVDNAWSERPDCAIYVFGSSISAANSTSWDASSTMISYDKSYFYGLFSFDLPNDASFIIRSNVSGSGDGYQTVDITPSDTFYSSLSSSKALKINWNNNSKCTTETMDLGVGESDMAAILSNTVTCDSSAVYGYNSYPQLKATIFDHTDSTVLAATDLNVHDFDYTNAEVYDQATHSYVTLSNRTVYTSIVDKIARMKQNYDAQSNHATASGLLSVGKDSPEVGAPILTAVVIGSGLAAGAYFLVRKKHAA